MNHHQINDTIEIGSLAESSFESYITSNFSNAKKIIVVDENTHDYCLDYLLTNFDFLSDAEVILLPVGEENKVLEVCFQVWEALSEYNVGRKDLIINLGGGVVTDMGGFIASIYKRGVQFINIPTTLLGMIDASIGGKTGIDLGSHKNQLGVINHPQKIYVDKTFLTTLPSHEILFGFAEALKHALIADASLWKMLTNIKQLDQIDENLLKTIIAVKLKIVNEDPNELGIRKILNFGHTVGHAIEGYFLSTNPIKHGHAVALGLIVESYISLKISNLSHKEFIEIEKVILEKYPIPSLLINDVPAIISLMKHDKKNHSNQIQFCLLNKIGDCVYDQVVEEEIIKEALNYLQSKA